MSDIIMSASELISKVRNTEPLVHNITNYVTVNDVANAELAIGGSPIMADDSAEVCDITSISSSLVINMGTLNSRTIEAMLLAGKRANELGIPVVFDPVGAGASALRNETAKMILENVKLAILRGNISEISFTAGLDVETKGVDASVADSGNDMEAVALATSKKYGCVTAVTGKIDAISDGQRIVRIENGHEMLSKVTGTGCMTSGLTGAFAGACGGDFFTAAVSGIACMGIAGEMAYEKAGRCGTGSFHIAIIDELSRIDGTIFSERARLYEK